LPQSLRAGCTGGDLICGVCSCLWNAIVNWLVIFALVYFFNRNITDSILISGAIVAVLAVLSISPAGEYLTRLQLGCRKATGLEAETFEPALQRVWERTAEFQSAGNRVVPIEARPTVYMSNNKFPNACAIGARTIILTTGLLGSVSDEELEGLLAHEISHLIHGDAIKRNVACTLNMAGNIASKILLVVIAVMGVIGRAVEAVLFGRVENGGSIIALLFAGIALVFKLALWVVQHLQEWGLSTVGRSEEYRADFYAMSLGFGPGLASFLSRIQYIEQAPQGLWAVLTQSHPPTAERIRRLEMG
jgi:heat shock protein HtpX